MSGTAIRDSHGGKYAGSRRLGLTPLQHMEIKDLARGAGGARPMPKQSLANRYGVSMEDISRIVSPEVS